jgi:hypothetical protein
MVGHQSGTAVSSGGLNTLVGYQAGSQISTGIGNTMFGYQAGGYGNHQYSIGIGYGVMQNADNTGDHNIAIGTWAIANAGLTGDYNVGVGYKAGYNLGAAAHKNITLGYQSGDNITTGDFNVIIGGGDAASATGDSQLDVSSGDGGVTWFTGDSNGNVKFNQLADIVTANGTTLTTAQSGSYVIWTGGTCTLPASCVAGTQFTIFNNTGSSATVGLGTSNSVLSGWAANAAVADHDATSYVAISSTNWVQVGA